MFQGVWWDLALALIGGGIMTQGIVGLAMGGDLPLVRIPESLKPLAKFVHTLTIFIGITLLLDKGTPDLLGRVLSELGLSLG